jgi:hypothetical protein
MPLLAIPGVGDMFADLRCICFLSRELVVAAKRVASMSEQGKGQIQVQLVGFFTRRRLSPL